MLGNEKHGWGKLTESNGSAYEGSFKHDLKDGYGELKVGPI